jgi:hypothetical protein
MTKNTINIQQFSNSQNMIIIIMISVEDLKKNHQWIQLTIVFKNILINIHKVLKVRATLILIIRLLNNKKLMNMNQNQKLNLKWIHIIIIEKLSYTLKKIYKMCRKKIIFQTTKELIINSTIINSNITIKTISRKTKEDLNKRKTNK